MLELKNLGLSLHHNVLVKPLQLAVAAGEIVTVMGPSGSGKSSLLSAIGGDLADAFVVHGTVVLNGRPIQNLPLEKRGIARLFQDDLLFPHMTVGENLLFAVPAMHKPARIAKVQEALHRVQLSGFEQRAPHTLSGGQRQRVALMRALLANPQAILLDEPFSKLDKVLRSQMRADVYAHIKDRQIPALLVTHDRDDAPPGGRIFEISESHEVRHV
jgi:putative thiamine transport system ATP-binding protein